MALTETEVFDQMLTSLRGAIDDCEIIARQPVSGVYFDRMRSRLKLVEGCCRQAAAFREDTRWLPVGVMMEQAHQRARFWLHRPSVQSKKLFTILADKLRLLEKATTQIRDQKTGRRGIILPDMQKAPGRVPGMVQVPRGFVRTSGGVIAPIRLQ